MDNQLLLVSFAEWVGNEWSYDRILTRRDLDTFIHSRESDHIKIMDYDYVSKTGLLNHDKKEVSV